MRVAVAWKYGRAIWSQTVSDADLQLSLRQGGEL